MRDFLKSVRAKILIGILMFMIGFMIAAIYTGGTVPLLSQVVNFVVEPFQRFSAGVTGGVTDFFDKYLQSAHNFEENKLLREEVAELRRQLVDYEKIKHENEQYEKITDIREQFDDQTFATASVIARDYSNAFQNFTIDKGTLDNIKLRDPVITEDGLVGYVTEVGLSTAQVMTILDVNMNVGASNNATRDPGNVTGTVDLALAGQCKLTYLPRDSETEAGDIIVTSGSSLFPGDLVIGIVTEVSTSSRGNSLEAVIQPAVDVKNIKDVFIITHFEGQGED